MRLVEDIATLKNLVGEVKQNGRSIGLVPTMGFLHEGHLSLMRAAKAENDFLVATIFVNPLQFGPGEDYDRYPRDPAGDRQRAAAAGCDLLFIPPVKEMYPSEQATFVEVTTLTEGLCGASRPGHFRGVTTVVAKLFNLVGPTRAYFGQKDAQQAFVLKKMVEDLNMDLQLVIKPTVREADGLAMSSRNKYLSADQRREAAVIFQGLQEAVEEIKSGERIAAKLKHTIMRRISTAAEARPVYIEIVDTKKLRPVSTVAGSCLIAVAVIFGQTRLIDNMIVEV